MSTLDLFMIPATRNNMASKLTVHSRSTSRPFGSLSNLVLEDKSAKKSIYKGKFHKIHGANIQLSADRNTATCTSTDYRQRFVFSSRPIAIDEILQLNVEVDATDEEVSFGFGFSSLDPNTMTDPMEFHEKYYKCAKIWTHDEPIFGDGINLAYSIDASGSVTYTAGEDNVEIKVRNLDVTNPLWGILYVRGESTTVTIVKTENVFKAPNDNTETEHRTETTTKDTTRTLDYQLMATKMMKRSVGFNLHQVWFFGENELQQDEQVYIKIEKKSYEDKDSIVFGLTTVNPNNLEWQDIPLNHKLKSNETKKWFTIDTIDHSQFLEGDGLTYHLIGNEIKYRFNDDEERSLKRPDDMRKKKVWPFLKINGYKIRMKMYLAKIQHHRTKVERNRRNNNDDENCCTICYENNIDSVLYACGHMNMCFDCGFKQWKASGGGLCPICRAAIKDVIRVYK